jgi:threonine synthase
VGSAVAHGFLSVPGIRVVILYPSKRISEAQEKQFTTLGENITALEVNGTFDDCQRLVKQAFSDEALNKRAFLTSANSINIGRLLPQMVYYFHALAQLGPSLGGGRAVVSTPSGNFGNLTAGLMAKRAGLPIARFVASTNVNDVVPSYLETGMFEPRPSRRTLSNAMDVGNPSNFDRMYWMYGGSVEAMRRDIVGSHHTDDEVVATIRKVYEERGYLLDPHSAVAYLGLIRAGGVEPDAPGIFLATAHPAKFHEIVEVVIEREIEKPAALVEALARPQHIMRIDASLEAVKEHLLG